jgi:hypothetical protein
VAPGGALRAVKALHNPLLQQLVEAGAVFFGVGRIADSK